jgi:EAL domain-containing protein (putative c-di-GMP-specific phosphodiesterase class I)
LKNCTLKEGQRIAENIRKDINDLAFIYDDKMFDIGVSMGVAVINGNNDQFEEIIIAAENGCQMAKRDGRNRIHVIDASKEEYQTHIDQINWLSKLSNAITNNDFILYGQKIAPINGDLSNKHYELLIRLKNADGTISFPDSFIPAAERYDLMPIIDRWVLEAAFSLAKSDTSYSINLSGQSLIDDSLPSFIESLLDKYKVEANNITLEITETAAIQNIQTCIKLINRLKIKGIKFSLDDFGSGLSSFTYLKNLPIDFLKIDGSFIKDIASDAISYAMVKSINELGHLMHIKTIAEYVENKEILIKLKEIGVDYVQGYYIHKPAQMESD